MLWLVAFVCETVGISFLIIWDVKTRPSKVPAKIGDSRRFYRDNMKWPIRANFILCAGAVLFLIGSRGWVALIFILIAFIQALTCARNMNTRDWWHERIPEGDRIDAQVDEANARIEALPEPFRTQVKAATAEMERLFMPPLRQRRRSKKVKPED